MNHLLNTNHVCKSSKEREKKENSWSMKLGKEVFMEEETFELSLEKWIGLGSRDEQHPWWGIKIIAFVRWRVWLLYMWLDTLFLGKGSHEILCIRKYHYILKSQRFQVSMNGWKEKCERMNKYRLHDIPDVTVFWYKLSRSSCLQIPWKVTYFPRTSLFTRTAGS